MLKHQPIPDFSPRELKLFWSRVEMIPESTCWYWTGFCTQDGYGRIRFSTGGISYIATRIMYRLEYGTDPGEMNVLHRCDNPPCMNPRHLFLGSQADNVADMIAKGRDRKAPQAGERNPGSKLTDATVQSIIREYAYAGISQSGIARKHGISQTNVSLIVNRKTWRHVQPKPTKPMSCD